MAAVDVKFICLDVANGYSEHVRLNEQINIARFKIQDLMFVVYCNQFVNHVRRTREAYPKVTLIAGNVVTGEMVEELILSGADIVKVYELFDFGKHQYLLYFILKYFSTWLTKLQITY